MVFRRRKKDELVAVKPPVEIVNPVEEEIERQTIQQMEETPQQVVTPTIQQPVQPGVQPQQVVQQPTTQPQVQIVKATEYEIIDQKLNYLIQIIEDELAKE